MKASTKKKPGSSTGQKAKATQAGGQDSTPIFDLSAEAQEFIEKFTKERGISLKDRVLLAIKDGAEHTAKAIFDELRDQIPPELAVEDPTAAKDKQLNAGREALLAVAIQALKAKEQVVVEGMDANGAWSADATVKLAPLPQDARFDIDKEFQNLLPPQSPSEIAQLEQQLLTEGCRDALTVWDNAACPYLVDGHTRLAICRRHGLTYELRSLSLPDRAAVCEWIWSQHYGRRNLTPEAESYRRGRVFNRVKQRGGDRTRGAKAQNAHLGSTAKALAQEFRVSRGTILRDGRFAEAVDSIIAAAGERGEEFRQRLLSRTLRLKAAEIKVLASKGKGETARLVKKLLDDQAVELGSNKTSTVLRIALPRGKAEEQAQVLWKSLKRPGLVKLIAELTRLVQGDDKGEAEGVEDTNAPEMQEGS